MRTYPTLVAIGILAACGSVAAAERNVLQGAANPHEYQLNNYDTYVLESVSPKYPQSMLEQNREGSVTLRATVQENGTICNVRVIAATTEIFGEAAQNAFAQWLFEPGKRHGISIRQDITLDIDFRIDGLPSRSGRQLASL